MTFTEVMRPADMLPGDRFSENGVDWVVESVMKDENADVWRAVCRADPPTVHFAWRHGHTHRVTRSVPKADVNRGAIRVGRPGEATTSVRVQAGHDIQHTDRTEMTVTDNHIMEVLLDRLDDAKRRYTALCRNVAFQTSRRDSALEDIERLEMQLAEIGFDVHTQDIRYEAEHLKDKITQIMDSTAEQSSNTDQA